MRYLADTHVLLWSKQAPEQLGPKARAIMADARQEVFFSVASIWEIAIKMALGKLKLEATLEEFVDAQRRNALQLLPIRVTHAIGVSALPKHHGDPFDRMLIAQAQVEKLEIITVDPAFHLYRVGTVW